MQLCYARIMELKYCYAELYSRFEMFSYETKRIKKIVNVTNWI